MSNVSKIGKEPYFVILSGTYCSAEISAEFGKLPPCFLPLGDQRLYDRQVALARRLGAIPVVTLPSDYKLSPWDAKRLADDKTRIVRSPARLSLNEAVQLVLEVLETTGPIYLLFGDTLVSGQGLEELDRAAIKTTQSHYVWSEPDIKPDGALSIKAGYAAGVSSRSVLCGYFVFSDASLLQQACVSAHNFDESLTAYAAQKRLELFDVDQWYDFGHLPLIYRSRSEIMVSRSFNRVQSDGISVTKSSADVNKMAAEANWYQTIPGEIKVFTPHFLGFDAKAGAYKLEYLYLPTLAEIHTFGELPALVWRRILDNCADFLQECWRHTPPIDQIDEPHRQFDQMFREKTWQRFKMFLDSRSWTENKSVTVNGIQGPQLGEVFQGLLNSIRPSEAKDISIWHGDFFFGNILYDFRASRVRTIDPRGLGLDGNLSIFGDRRYDIAKLAHSIIGNYDILIAKRVEFKKLGETDFHFLLCRSGVQLEVDRLFRHLKIGGVPVCTREIVAMTAILFFSMLPLHIDDTERQDILLCNGLGLAAEVLQWS